MPKRAIHYREYFLLNMSLVIRLLIISDVVWMGAIGLLGPIFSLYIVEFIDGANAAVAGTAAAIYLITKSILQVPAAAIIDKIHGEKDDFWILFIGSLVGAATPLLYLVIHTSGQLYAVQFLYGAVMAFTFPSYMALFTRHIDNGREGTDWGVYFTLVDLSTAITASVGGVIATMLGYRYLIIASVAISVLGASLLYPIRRQLFK
ncbi:MAG: MFS transporter [Patescibacteria group bacterium]